MLGAAVQSSFYANKSPSGRGCTTINAFPAYAAISPFIGWWIVVPPPKHCSLRLQSRSGPNDDGSAIAVAAIYYGKESSLDVSDVELATVGGAGTMMTMMMTLPTRLG
jgi:hypothetical protein